MQNTLAKPVSKIQPAFEFYAQAQTPTISIDGIIGFSITNREFRQELNRYRGKDVAVEISSPGGFVYQGIGIYNAIRDHDGFVEVRLVGLAASMASYIALAGDRITAHDNAVYMIHNVWGLAIGDHRDLRKGANVMEGLTKILAQAYSEKSGKSAEEIRGMMNNDTHLFGEEMVKAGFVDEIIKTDKKKNKKAALTGARSEIQACHDQMKAAREQAKKDWQELAAMIDGESDLLASDKIELTGEEKPEPNNELLNNNQTPVTTGTPEEINRMSTLNELLAQHPLAKIDFDKAIQTAKDEELKAERERLAKAAEVVSPILASDKYGKSIKGLAVKVMAGVVDVGSFISSVAGVDEINELNKSNLAKKEGEELDDTPAGGSGQSADGQINNAADMGRESAAMADSLGIASAVVPVETGGQK